MMRVLIISILFFPSTVLSQTYINKTKAKVRKELEKFSIKNDNLKTAFKETDSTLTFSIHDSRFLPVDYFYRFDKTGKCNMEKITASCDSCINTYLQTALNRKEYEWKKINETQYISGFSKKMFLEIPADTTVHSFMIFRMNLSKEMYTTLLGK